MKRLLIVLALACICTSPREAVAQHDHPQLGKVSFPTSCDPKVQPEFERGVAMLHSYWFNYAGKTFLAVLEQDPKCVMAYWGVAMDLLGNTLAFAPPRQTAGKAWDLLEKARTIEVKTEPGLATSFILDLPLTLASMRGLFIRVGDQTFVVPSLAVEQIVPFAPESLVTVAGKTSGGSDM